MTHFGGHYMEKAYRWVHISGERGLGLATAILVKYHWRVINRADHY